MKMNNPPSQGGDPYNAYKACERELRILRHESANKQLEIVKKFGEQINDIKSAHRAALKEAYKYYTIAEAAKEFVEEFRSCAEPAEDLESLDKLLDIIGKLPGE